MEHSPRTTEAAPRIGERPGQTVELRGLEPLTPTLPVWCATRCATAPCNPVWYVRAGSNCTGLRSRSPAGVATPRDGGAATLRTAGRARDEGSDEGLRRGLSPVSSARCGGDC